MAESPARTVLAPAGCSASINHSITQSLNQSIKSNQIKSNQIKSINQSNQIKSINQSNQIKSKQSINCGISQCRVSQICPVHSTMARSFESLSCPLSHFARPEFFVQTLQLAEGEMARKLFWCVRLLLDAASPTVQLVAPYGAILLPNWFDLSAEPVCCIEAPAARSNSICSPNNSSLGTETVYGWVWQYGNHGNHGNLQIENWMRMPWGKYSQMEVQLTFWDATC